jgi:hypothetical protein
VVSLIAATLAAPFSDGCVNAAAVAPIPPNGFAEPRPSGTSQSVEGYAVITSDESKLGHVAGTIGDNVVVEHGLIRKSKHPVPKVFAHVDDTERVVRLSVSKEIVESAPKVTDDGLDEQAVAEHYGLASAFEAPETEGYGEVLPDDPGRTAEEDARRAGIETAEQERLGVRSGEDPAAQQQTTSPGLLGERKPES